MSDVTPIPDGLRSVGYYASWRATGPGGPTLRRLFVDGGMGEHLTHLNYAFANIAGSAEALDAARVRGVRGLDGVAPYTAFLSDHEDPHGGETDVAGNLVAEMLHLFSAEDSVAGVADTPEQPLAGIFHQLRLLKERLPHLRVLVSLGGWAWSRSFSAAVATPERRTALVASLVDVWLRGNLPVVDGRGGPGSAAGIFDGIDLDWEWPAMPAETQMPGNGVDLDHDRENFLAFAAELRRALDDLGTETGRAFEISAFLPASHDAAVAGGWNTPEMFSALDFGNLQGYDLRGPWDATPGHQGNVYPDPDPARGSGRGIETVVATYVDAGVDPAQLNLGMADYGYGWRGGEREPWGPAEGLATQDDGTAALGWDRLRERGLEIVHDTVDGRFNATYGYDAQRREWWTFDDPTAIEAKTRWALAQGLGGIDHWEVAHDPDAELVRTGADTLRAVARERSTPL